MKKELSLKIQNKVINSKADLDALNFKDEEKALLTIKILNVLLYFDTTPFIEIDDVKTLKQVNALLRRKLEGLLIQSAIDKSMLKFHEKHFSSVAADLLINPNPVTIHCTEKNKGIDFVISLMDILVIKSEGRIKTIFLRKPIAPKEGGPKQEKIETNDNQINFDKLLNKIQKNQIHLQMINRSTAINIYHYVLNENKFFNLSVPHSKNFPSDLKSIVIDKTFDSTLYHKRLFDIDYINKSHIDFRVTKAKLDEITHYKNSLLLT